MKKTDCLAYGAAMFAIAAACHCARAGTIEWSSGDLVIPAGDELTLTEPKTNSSVMIHGTFALNLGAGSRQFGIHANDDPKNATTSHLAPDPGDVALWKTGPGYVYGYYNNDPKANLQIGANGGGNGLLHIGAFQGSNGNLAPCWFNYVTLSANAQTDADVFMPFLLDAYGSLMCKKLINDNAKPLQVTFTNQWNVISNNYRHFSAYLYAFYNASLFSTKKAGGDIILRGYPNAPIMLRGWNGYGFNMFDASADNRKALVRLEGDCEAWFFMNKSWCIFNATNIAYNHSGDTRFVFPSSNGGYVRTLVENVLPWGLGTGNLVIETIDTTATAQKNLDLHGCSQKLNGLVIRGEAHLVNTNGTATLTFGAGDVGHALAGERRRAFARRHERRRDRRRRRIQPRALAHDRRAAVVRQRRDAHGGRMARGGECVGIARQLASDERRASGIPRSSRYAVHQGGGPLRHVCHA